MWLNYLKPTSIEEASQMMVDAKSSLAVIAGGTDLILDIQQGRHKPVDSMIDVTGIPEMQKIQMEDGQIFFGAAVTLSNIIQSKTLQDHAQCLVESCGLIGGPQIRNVATIGGNVGHALPAADGSIALLALNAEVQIASSKERRWQPLDKLFISPGKTTFDRNQELIVGFRFPLRKTGEASAFKRVMRPQGVAIAILNMAIWLKSKDNQILENVRIAMGPAGPRPFRAKETEDFLKGKRLDDIEFQHTYEVLDGEVQLRTSPHRATAEYRHHLIPILFKQIYESTVNRVNQNPGDNAYE